LPFVFLHLAVYALYKILYSWAWRLTPAIPALWGLRKEDHRFDASLGYTARLCHKANPNIKYCL
jgi:hypothetical protein